MLLGSKLWTWAARLGSFWYAIPSAIVVLLGLATCNFVDTTDYDAFRVEASAENATGTRSAVVVRQWHSDSSATVKCIWLLAGPPPSSGPSVRRSPSCALVATDPDAALALRWQPNGKLLVKLPPGTTASPSDPYHSRCYFEWDQLGKHVCYSPEQVEVEERP